MQFTVKVQLEASPALTECINALASALGGKQPQVINPLQAENAKTVEDNSTMTVAVVAEKNPEKATEVHIEEPKHKEITDEELRAIVGPKTKEVGKDKVFAILGEFGVKRVPDLTQEQRVEFLEKLRAI